jgi:hypothetical protein
MPTQYGAKFSRERLQDISTSSLIWKPSLGCDLELSANAVTDMLIQSVGLTSADPCFDCAGHKNSSHDLYVCFAGKNCERSGNSHLRRSESVWT